MKTYPSFTLEYVRKQLTSAQGWAYYAWAMEDVVTMFGGHLTRVSPGYIKQEIERIREERKQSNA